MTREEYVGNLPRDYEGSSSNTEHADEKPG